MKYNHKEIEQKWQAIWATEQTFAAEEQSYRPRFYALVEFPYPSGEGLHMGHPRPYTALDIVARKRRLQGYNVLFPMGWDAFGLPTENFAIKHNIHPREVTERNIARFKQQLQSIGLSFDWSREINTTDPDYYKWTQWIFLQMFHKGLAYKAKMAVNWCTGCQVVLANEEVIDGRCERCDSEVVQREKSQWMLAITKYADRLIDDLDLVEYPERVRSSQIHWIGRSTGMNVYFNTTTDDTVTVFTTRPDTLYGVTYLVLSPEHPYLQQWAGQITNLAEVAAYQEQASKKSDFERAELAKDKTGVKLEGVAAIHPITGEKIPVFLSDYVLMSYGTGAIMAVPAHDTRDWEFAHKFDIPMVEVVAGGNIADAAYTNTEQGTMVNSGFLNGLAVDDAKTTIAKWLVEQEKGEKKVNFKLRDWVFSRQRYWGEPIPIVHCDTCGYVPLDEADLPLVLPEVESYKPGKDGESPLAELHDWVNTTCPKCGGPAKRETDTMPQWAGSSWYYLRYCDPHNQTVLASKEEIDYWMPVDWYNGGMEHTTLHLLYSRFWYKFLYDIGVTPNKEPYTKRTSHGMILGTNGEKMSKSRGNVINPDDVVEEFGADTLRMYEMFIGDFEKSAPWNPDSLRGCRRYLERVYSLPVLLTEGTEYSPQRETLLHQTIRKVTDDIENMKFNTAIAALMTLQNKVEETGQINKAELQTYLTLLNPFAPHLTEELWQQCRFARQISAGVWPEYDPAKCVEAVVEVVFQVNGKIRARAEIETHTTKEAMLTLAKEHPAILGEITGKQVVKEVVIPGKLVNIVVK